MDKRKSFLDKIKKRKDKKEVRDVRPWDLLKGKSEFTKPEIVNARLSICKQCPEFIDLTKQCKICFCIMPAKALLANASCPLHKWESTNIYADEAIEDNFEEHNKNE